MDTPIADFITSYVSGDPVRLHMPGHKGDPEIDGAVRDITEIKGTDSLIGRSQANASEIFGCPTFYSAEGSSLCIRAMCNIVTNLTGKRLIVASRNVHQTFITACALLDIEVEWLPFEGGDHLYYNTDPKAVERVLERTDPACVYITSPDYLGMVNDIESIADVCHRRGVMLAVDNAHGAYLRFFDSHPMQLGADICCDSAHKTLPVLTGGAYLHVTPDILARTDVSRSLSLFASTSPSWLILESLDKANGIMASAEFTSKIKAAAARVSQIREKHNGFFIGNEYLKLSIPARKLGCDGRKLADYFRGYGIEPEMGDLTAVTLMFSPYNADRDFEVLEKALSELKVRPEITTEIPSIPHPVRVASIREAVLCAPVKVPVDEAEGRIASFNKTSCPPAIPIVIAGERITREHIEVLKIFGYEEVEVMP